MKRLVLSLVTTVTAVSLALPMAAANAAEVTTCDRLLGRCWTHDLGHGYFHRPVFSHNHYPVVGFPGHISLPEQPNSK